MRGLRVLSRHSVPLCSVPRLVSRPSALPASRRRSSTLKGLKEATAPSTQRRRRDHTDFDAVNDDVPRLAKKQLHPLSLADLVKHGRPPLSAEALLSSARFTLSLLPIRLAHRIQALRNLPFIVVDNPNINKIYNNYQHSYSTLLPWKERTISNLEDEIRFTEVLAELVKTHTDTIPILAKGFLESRKYISPEEVTRFLDQHLRARIGTRLIAEQHIALHFSSTPHFDPGASPTPCPEHPSFIGVIDTALKPAALINRCGEFVAEICELQYGVRPKWEIDGEPDTTYAYVPMHLEYIITELLKNAFRATVENCSPGKLEPIVITIAPEPPTAARTGPAQDLDEEHVYTPPRGDGHRDTGSMEADAGGVPGGSVALGPRHASLGEFRSDDIRPLDDNAPGVTIRIRDRGGGIQPDVLPNIWSYSFTTFNDDQDLPPGGTEGGSDALNVISQASSGSSSIAGLGYGLPLSRAYAEYFGGGIAVQSLYGWGTDVYLRLNGVGRIEEKPATTDN